MAQASLGRCRRWTRLVELTHLSLILGLALFLCVTAETQKTSFFESSILVYYTLSVV